MLTLIIHHKISYHNQLHLHTCSSKERANYKPTNNQLTDYPLKPLAILTVRPQRSVQGGSDLE